MCTPPSHANDSTARVGTGGITLLKSQDISMRSELLEISTARIHVRYEFLNEGRADIHTQVAFPLPAYGWNAGESALDLNDHALRPFHVTVDGHPVSVTMHRKAMAQGRDVTPTLRRLGLSDHEIFDTFAHCTVEDCTQPPTRAAAIAKLSDAEGRPAWTVHETALWQQTFPKARPLTVEHDYTPMVGVVYSVPFQGGVWTDPDHPLPTPARATDVPTGPDDVCLNQGARAALDDRMRQTIASGAKGLMVYLSDVEYILGTGRNWKGPIRDFTLRVEKPSPDTIVALCFDSPPTLTTPSLIEYHARDFVPPDRLIVHFYRVEPGDF